MPSYPETAQHPREAPSRPDTLARAISKLTGADLRMVQLILRAQAVVVLSRLRQGEEVRLPRIGILRAHRRRVNARNIAPARPALAFDQPEPGVVVVQQAAPDGDRETVGVRASIGLTRVASRVLRGLDALPEAHRVNMVRHPRASRPPTDTDFRRRLRKITGRLERALTMESVWGDGRLADPPQMAQLLQLSVGWVSTQRKAGRIPAVKLGNRWRYEPARVLAALKELHRQGR